MSELNEFDEYAEWGGRANFERLARQGASDFEEWLAGPYKVQWHEVWQAGRRANEQGISRDDNPYTLKVWKAVWEYGWDNYDPNQQGEFTIVDNYLKTLPTRPIEEGDL